MSHEKFFLGSATPNGFVTSIGSLLSDTKTTSYILKGTAGSGKSTLMKKISAAFADSPQELYYCSADPNSLDAVYLKDRHVLIMDGTAPHCTDPVYPIAVETIIDLGAHLNSTPLRLNKEKIISLTNEYSGYHKRCRLCLAAISSVVTDIISAASEAIDREKLRTFTARTSKRLIPRKNSSGQTGNRTAKQLSAISMNGYATYIPDDYKIYLLNDDNIAASDLFLKELSDIAVHKGYNVTISECLMHNERFTEHILIPELNIAFISSNCINRITLESPKKVINFRRFYSNDIFVSNKNLKQRIKFGKKAASELLGEAVSALKTAKELHDRIEDFYISAADFDSLNRLCYKLISEIKSLN